MFFQFYADAYRAAVEIVGGEQYILSATMHADERNRAMSEALGEDVYHYHLHVVYIPVVEKQILWSERCKDKSLIGTVKETITQVSRSKKWESKPAQDADGNPLLSKTGKKVLTPLTASSRISSSISCEPPVTPMWSEDSAAAQSIAEAEIDDLEDQKKAAQLEAKEAADFDRVKKALGKDKVEAAVESVKQEEARVHAEKHRKRLYTR